MTTPTVTTQQVSKWFGEVVALNRLSVSIYPGVTGLLGPNGAGKTTFMKLALGLYKPSRGSVTILGQKPRNNFSLMRHIGYCPESDRFHDVMTGYEFTYWLTRFNGLEKAHAQKAAHEACERVGLYHRMNDPITSYSRGMRQRLNLAQAIANDPDILFLDEPMTGLDPQGREEMYALIRALGSEGKTVIVSSHILYEIERITNNVVLIHNGTLLADGSISHIRELIDKHPHTVTVECETPRIVGDAFAQDPAILSMEFEGKTVTIRTTDPAQFYPKLNQLILDKHLDIQGITCPDNNLQAVFDYLMGKE